MAMALGWTKWSRLKLEKVNSNPPSMAASLRPSRRFNNSHMPSIINGYGSKYSAPRATGSGSARYRNWCSG